MNQFKDIICRSGLQRLYSQNVDANYLWHHLVACLQCSLIILTVECPGSLCPTFGTMDVFVSLFGCNLVDIYPTFHFEVKMSFRMSSVKIKCLLLFAMFNNIFSSNVLYDDKTVTEPMCRWSTVQTNLKPKIASLDHLVTWQ